MKAIELTLKMLGTLLLGAVVLVLLPIAIISGLLMRLPLGKLFRAFIAIGAAALAVHEIAVLLDIDHKKAQAKIAEWVQSPGKVFGHKLAVAEDPIHHDLAAALMALGFKKADAEAKATEVIDSNPGQTDLAVLTRRALVQKVAA